VLKDNDLYQAFYTDHLWRLIPEVYRASDSSDPDQPGPLRELTARLGAQIAVVRRSIDRTLEDQSIESSDDWLIPYIGDLLATNLVAGLDARAQRLDVYKTIYYRRRKGTVGILEEIAANITGWNARAVEFFRRLARTRHNFDPEIGLERDSALIDGLCGALTGTPAGGYADLRGLPGGLGASGSQKANTAFDEFFHTADFRRGRDGSGWHNIPKLGFFLWRLRSYHYVLVDPVEDSVCAGQFTFDPTGREIPLCARDFRDPKQYGDVWVTPDEWMLPGRISADLLAREAAHLYPGALEVVDLSAAGETQVPFANLRIHPERGRFQPSAEAAPGVARLVKYHHGFSSEIGAGPYDRDTLRMDELPEPAGPRQNVSGGGAALAGALGAAGMITIADSRTYTSAANPWSVSDVLVNTNENQAPLLRLSGAAWVISGAANATLALEGLFVTGTDIVLRGDFDRVTLSCCTLDPGEEVQLSGMPRTVDGRPLNPTALWVEGEVRELILRRSITGPIRTRGKGKIEFISTTDSIVQGVRTTLPGLLSAGEIADPHLLARRLKSGMDPLTVFLRGSFAAPVTAALAAYDPLNPPDAALAATLIGALNAILGGAMIYTASRFAGIPLPDALNPPPSGLTGADLLRANHFLLEAAFPIELQPAAVATSTAHVSLERTTVLGSLHAHRVSASESILHQFSVAEDTQSGCVRFSAFVEGSQLHQPYESVAIGERAGIFHSRRFGDPDYAQLTRLADREIRIGAPGATISAGTQDGSEMGAFALEKNPIKERGLRIKLSEFMPIGLTPVLIFVT
jgi:hypothetical protein